MSCPRCDPRPIPDFPTVALCDDCRRDLERGASVTTGAQRGPGRPWKATGASTGFPEYAAAGTGPDGRGDDEGD